MNPTRPIWPWVLGGALAVLASVIVFVVSFAASGIVDGLANATEERAVAQTVLAFDTAYEEQDCDAFQNLVDGDLADQMVDDDFDCESWVAIAASLRRDGEYTYSMDVIDVHASGDVASVHTEESVGEAAPADYDYTLERSDHGWVIVAYSRR